MVGRTQLDLFDIGSDYIILHWNKPDSEPVGVSVQYKPLYADHDDTWVDIANGRPLSNNIMLKKNLTPSTVYTFRCKEEQESEYSVQSEEWRTLDVGSIRPSQPTLVSAETNAITVEWDAYIGDNITYKLQVRGDTASEWSNVSSELKGTTVRKRNLTPGRSYSFRIRAIEAGGNDGEKIMSPYSKPSDFIALKVLSSVFRNLFGETLITAQGENVNVDILAGKVVGVYCSASWCGPCRQFTPKLAQMHAEFKAKGLPFEVVFASADRDDKSMKAYFSKMPWLAIPYENQEQISGIMQTYEVTGIPRLIIFSPTGQVVSTSAVQTPVTEGMVRQWASM
eukprot:CFRG7768T1